MRVIHPVMATPLCLSLACTHRELEKHEARSCEEYKTIPRGSFALFNVLSTSISDAELYIVIVSRYVTNFTSLTLDDLGSKRPALIVA